MADLMKIIEAGKALGLEGADLQQFMKEEREREREIEREREAAERDRRAEERELQKAKLELERLKLEADTKKGNNESQASTIRIPKIPAFNERSDEIDPYLHRFELYANNMKWPKQEWCACLTNLLTGQALNVLHSLSLDDVQDYDKVKQALLKRFQYTEDGFHERFKKSKPEIDENFDTFVNRISKYLDRWTELAGIRNNNYNALYGLIIKDQIYSSCHQDLVAFLKERKPATIQEIKSLADQYISAHPDRPLAKSTVTTTCYANVADGQRSRAPSRTNVNLRTRTQSVDPSTFRKRQQNHKGFNPQRNNINDICQFCNKPGHTADRCYQIVGKQKNIEITETRPVTTTCQICSKTGHSADRCYQLKSYAINARKPLITCQICKKQGHGADKCYRYTKPKKQSANLACNVSDVDNLFIANTNIEDITGCLRFHVGKVNDRPCTILRDTGTNTVGVKSHLIREQDVTNSTAKCLVYGGKTETFPIARVFLDTPFFKGHVLAHVLQDSVADVILGNIKGIDDSHYWNDSEPIDNTTLQSAYPAVTRSASKKEMGQSQDNCSSVTPVDTHAPTDNLWTSPEAFGLMQRNDPDILKILNDKNQIDSGKYVINNGILYRKFERKGRSFTQMIVPKSLRVKILSLGHDSFYGGHLGIAATKKRIMPHFSWKGITYDIKDYVRSCDICQRKAPKGRTPDLPLEKMEIIETPFEKVAIDIIGPLPLTRKHNRFILTMVDFATRWAEAIPLQRITTEHIADALIEIFARVGTPKILLSDNGQQLVSNAMKEVLALMGITQRNSTPYHQQANGLCERFNQTLKSILKKVSDGKPHDWDEHIPALLFAYREIPQSSTGFSPFELLYGRTPRGPLAIVKDLCAGDNNVDGNFIFAYDYAIQLKDKIQDMCKIAQDNVSNTFDKHKVYADRTRKPRKLNNGDLVLAFLPDNNNSLTMTYKGPYKIVKTRQNNNYDVQVGNTVKTYHANILKTYFSRSTNQGHTPFQVANVSLISDDTSEQCSLASAMPEIAFARDSQSESFTDVKINPAVQGYNRQATEMLLREFADTLTDIPGQTSCIAHTIKLTSDVPVKSKLYPTPLHAQDEVKKELEMMLNLGVIRRSNSPYSSSIVVVRKKDGKIRLCVDFRKLNSITVFDAEPIPNQDVLMSSLSHAIHFSKVDLSKGYWQIPLEEECKHFTAFQSPLGLMEFNFLPFGLSTAASTFQRMMRHILRDVPNAISYFDDILVFGRTWDEHLTALQNVFQTLRDNGLTARPSKTVIGFQEIEFLGHVVGNGFQRPGKSKVERIMSLQPPKTKKEVRSVLGLLNYYRKFVPNFASIAFPLTELTKQGKPNKVQWNETCNNSFEEIKHLLANKPILSIPRLDKQFIIRTDASDHGIGGVLLQESDGHLMPCAYVSRKLLDRERNYSIIERECLAVVFTICAFEKYLLLTEFIIETDHKPLSFMKANKAKNSRLMRWALCLQQFNFQIRPIPGPENVHADVLSRLL